MPATPASRSFALCALLLAAISCGKSHSTTDLASTGTIVGAVTSSLGGSLAGAHVVVTPTGASASPAITTSSTGAYLATGVAVGDGSIAVSSLPTNCTAPSPTPYTGLTGNDTITVDVTVTCTALEAGTGLITGTVSGSQGTLPGVSVVATPHGGSALPAVSTNSSGVYVISGVPAGDGSIAVSSLPGWCTPGTTAYSGVSNADTIDVNVTASCVAPTGSVAGTVTSNRYGILSGVSVVVTPTGGVALPAVVTTSTGAYAVHGVPVGAGAVTVSAPVGCSAPPTPYTGLQYNATATTNISMSCPAPGALTVTVQGTPPGPYVVASGPYGFNQNLSVTTPFPVFPGTYFVGAVGTLITNDSIVNTTYKSTVTGSPATVVSNATTTANVTFTHPGGEGNLWVNWNSPAGTAGIVPFTAPELHANAAAPSARVIGIPATPAGDIWTIATDAQGTIWALAPGTATVQLSGTTRAQIDSGDFNAPDIEIKLSTPTQAYAMAFDANGTLWAAELLQIVGFTPAQLAASGTVTPTYTLQFPASANFQPHRMAFDSSGNLWVSGTALAASGQTQILSYTPAQLMAGGTPTPNITLNTTYNPWSIAFDANGTMWVSENDVSNGIVGYTASQLAADTATPAYSIPHLGTDPVSSIAFDASGDLWTAVSGPNPVLIELLGSSLTSGSPVVWRSTTLNASVSSLAFDPHAANLPLNGNGAHALPHPPAVRRK